MSRSGPEVAIVKFVKRVAMLCLFALPAAATSGSTATGPISFLRVNNTSGDIVYVFVGGIIGGSPPGCVHVSPYQYALPMTTAVNLDMFALLESAAQAGRTVTVRGLGVCNADLKVETLAS